MIHPLSLKSLFIQPYFNTERLSSATGFIVEKNKQFYLVTNRHVVTGKNTETNNCMRADAAVPNKLKIFLPDLVDKSIEWKTVDIFLYSGGTITDESKLWLEHSDGNRVDVVLVPLSDYKIQNKFQVCNFDLDLANADLVVEPAMPVSIIGFPLGYCGGGMLPIWVTGFIASEPEVDIDERPMLYVNASGRSGLSGSPVVLKADGNFRSSRGWEYSSSRVKFIGINSSRLNSKKKESLENNSSEICRVWKPCVIEQILNNKVKAE